MKNLDSLREEIRVFNRERDWEQFHSPKNLAIGLSIESSELLERFQWMPDSTSDKLEEAQLQNLRDEIGDVLIYLVNLADKLGLTGKGAAR